MDNLINQLKYYRKGIVAAVVGVLQILSLYVALSANGISNEDTQALIGAIIVAIAGTAGVVTVPNKKGNQIMHYGILGTIAVVLVIICACVYLFGRR